MTDPTPPAYPAPAAPPPAYPPPAYPPPAAPPRKSNALKIVLIVLGVVILLVVGLCAGLFALGRYVQSQEAAFTTGACLDSDGSTAAEAKVIDCTDPAARSMIVDTISTAGLVDPGSQCPFTATWTLDRGSGSGATLYCVADLDGPTIDDYAEGACLESGPLTALPAVVDCDDASADVEIAKIVTGATTADTAARCPSPTTSSYQVQVAAGQHALYCLKPPGASDIELFTIGSCINDIYLSDEITHVAVIPKVVPCTSPDAKAKIVEAVDDKHIADAGTVCPPEAVSVLELSRVSSTSRLLCLVQP